MTSLTISSHSAAPDPAAEGGAASPRGPPSSEEQLLQEGMALLRVQCWEWRAQTSPPALSSHWHVCVGLTLSSALGLPDVIPGRSLFLEVCWFWKAASKDTGNKGVWGPSVDLTLYLINLQYLLSLTGEMTLQLGEL